MTVQTSTTVATGIGNGVTTVFPVGFKFNRDEDLLVILIDSVTEEITQLVLNSDYTVQGAGNQEGGSVTVAVPVAEGKSIRTIRSVDLLQLTDLRNQGKFFAEVHEDTFDLIVMMIQQQQEQLNRSVKVSIGSDTPADELLAEFKADILLADAAAALSVEAKNVSQAIAEQFGDVESAITETEALRDEAQISAIQTAADVIATGVSVAQAEAAANSSMVKADLYEDTAAGLDPVTGVAEGKQFQVLAASGDEYSRYLHDTGGVATLLTPSGKGLPTSGSVAETRAILEDSKDDAGVHVRAQQVALSLGTDDPRKLNTFSDSGVYFDFARGDFLIESIVKSDVNRFDQLSVARSTPALALNLAGEYIEFDAGVLRATDRGVLLEGAATNLATLPDDFSVWTTFGGVSVASDALASPASGLADELVAGPSTGARVQKNYSLAPGTHTFSIFARKRDLRYFAFQIFGGGRAQSTYVAIDFDNDIAVLAAGSGDVVLHPLELVSDGYLRIPVTVPILSTATTEITVGPAGSMAYADRWTGYSDGQSIAGLWHHQIELAGEASSPFTGARAADAAVIEWAGSGRDTDSIAIEYEGGTAQFNRSDLAIPDRVNLVTDGSGEWLTKYISRIICQPAEADSYRTLAQRSDDHYTGLLAGAFAPLMSSVSRLMARTGLGRIGGLPDNALLPAALAPTDSGCTPYLYAVDGVYFWNGQPYATEAAMLEAAGASQAGNVITFADYTDGSDLFAGTIDFGDSVDGFDSRGGGALTSFSGGELVVDLAGPTPSYASKKFMGYGGRALKFSFTARRGTIPATAAGILFSRMTAALSSGTSGGSITGTGDQSYALRASGGNGGPMWMGWARFGGGGGTFFVDDFKVEEVFPARGWPQAVATYFVKGVAPSVLGSKQVIWQGDVNDVRDKIRLEISSGGVVSFAIDRNFGAGVNEQISTLDLGSLTASQEFRAAVSMSRGILRGSLNGSPAVSLEIVGTHGISHFRLGVNEAGTETFTGSRDGYAVYSGQATGPWLERITRTPSSKPVPFYDRDARTVCFHGDSYGENSSTGIGMTLEDMGYKLFNFSVGGSTFAAQHANIMTLGAEYLAITQVWWDGSPNGHTSGQIDIELGQIADWVNAIGHDRWLYVHSGQITGGVDQDDMAELYARVGQIYGNEHVYDAFPVIAKLAISDPDAAGYAADQAAIAAGRYPPSVLYDGVHLSKQARIAVSLDMDEAIQRLGGI